MKTGPRALHRGNTRVPGKNWDLVAEMTASAVIGAYTWWMDHPDAADVEVAKRQVERVTAAIVSSL